MFRAWWTLAFLFARRLCCSDFTIVSINPPPKKKTGVKSEGARQFHVFYFIVAAGVVACYLNKTVYLSIFGKEREQKGGKKEQKRWREIPCMLFERETESDRKKSHMAHDV